MNLQKVKSHWNERWQQVDTSQPTKSADYFISDFGRIKRIIRETGEETLLSGSKMKFGFRGLNFRITAQKRRSLYVHKFVAEHFLEKSQEDINLNRTFTIHLDGDKTNNHFKNLTWMNRDELTQHHKDIGVLSADRARKGLVVKMTETKVKLLKKRLLDGKTKKKILAKNFNISMMQLRRIEKGENWGHVTI